MDESFHPPTADRRRSRTARRLVASTAAVLFATLGLAGPSGADDAEYAIAGGRTAPEHVVSTGSEFALSGARAPLDPSVAGGDGFRLRPMPSSSLVVAPEGALCFCGDVLFADDFESGNAAAWSDIEP